MKKIAIFCALILGMTVNADAATAVNPRGRTSTATNNSTSTTSSTATARSATTTARSATATRSATPASTTTARSATAGRTTVSRAPTATTTSTANTARSATVAARAGATQKVISTGTSVAAANENVIVSEACRQKYYGCMDSFCMLDNDNGGRCICSDKNAEYDTILAEIEKLDMQSYQMATAGVNQIEMGDSAEAVIANANAVAQSIMDSAAEEDAKKQSLIDFDSWFSVADFTDDLFTDTDVTQNPIEGKEGDALFSASNQICVEQMPECASELSMLQLMYAQQIRSDCTAYENSLKQQRNSSAQKLYVAEQALRDAALEQYQTANKYNLGQCIVEFKNCMITTGGCGEDFSGCASVVASDKTNTQKSSSQSEKTYSIKGEITTIDIAATTYDVLVSKKPLCEGVTKQCQAVASQVWDRFLKEVAPQIKSAEKIAENDLRQNCVSNISSCFQQACKDTMDPNDPDGSYDLCLTRPEVMLNLCKVPLNSCGISEDPEEAQNSQIWELIVARLASMRVNSCTTQVKECLQSEDRCGSDYTQCVGLDSYTIIRMCPEELLVGCQNYDAGNSIEQTGLPEEDFYANLEPLVEGILVNIDNNLLKYCQEAADEAMITVCGDTENCNNLAVDEYIGTNTLEYKICKVNNYDDSTSVDYNSCYTNISQISDAELGRDTGLSQTTSTPLFATSQTPAVSNVTQSLESAMYVNANNSPKLAIIIEGEIPWDAVSFDDATGEVKINEAAVTDPDYLEKIKSELGVLQNNINNAIKTVEADTTVQYCMTGRTVQGINGKNLVSRDNATARFEGLTQQTRAMIAAAAIKIAQANYYDEYAKLEQQRMEDYVTLNERIAAVRQENLQDARRESARLACTGIANASAVATSSGKNNNYVAPEERELVGSKSVNNWNYKETITSTFNWETLVCHRCTRTQNCADPKGGRRFCKKWEDAVEECVDITF